MKKDNKIEIKIECVNPNPFKVKRATMTIRIGKIERESRFCCLE